MAHSCQKCTGLMDLERDASSKPVYWYWRCLNCGCQVPAVPPPQKVEKPSKSKKKNNYHIAKKASVPVLEPPPLPRSDEDFRGAYQIQCNTFSHYKHWIDRADFFKRVAQQSKAKNEKLSAGYRARLCENIASCLARAYTLQDRKTLRDLLRKQRRARHAISDSRPRLKALQRQLSYLMLQAISHIPNDPVVQEWQASMEALGQWRYLRTARKGLEKGVKRPYSSPSEALADQTILELAHDGLSPGKIRAKLKAEGLPARSREWIRKRIKQSGKERMSILKRSPSLS